MVRGEKEEYLRHKTLDQTIESKFTNDDTLALKQVYLPFDVCEAVIACRTHAEQQCEEGEENGKCVICQLNKRIFPKS